MITITIQTNTKKTFSIACDSVQTDDVFGLLENSISVTAYKITIPAIGVLNEQQLKYYYSGYKNPSGKAVDRFKW